MTQGTVKLGIEFADWSGPGSRYMHAFGPVGRSLGILPFHQHWLQVMIGQGVEFEGWSPLAERVPVHDLDRFLADVRAKTHATARALPAHAAFVARHCAAPQRT